MWRTERSKVSRFRAVLLAVLVAGLVGSRGAVLAQTPPDLPPQDQSQSLDPQQLDNLVAPIALYPDPLLGQVLVASTYPVELVEAQQWLQANSRLEGQQLTDAARQQNWDPSVQALVAMPDVLEKLNQDIRWTTDLGNAFLAREADVMSAVQRMRARARANGRLESTPEENVTTEQRNGQEAIQILPADPQVIYVPTYDPAYVWGPPAWGYYPPLYYPEGGFWYGPGIDISFCFGGGWGGWGFGGWGWGWGPNWFGGSVFVNNFFFNHYGYRGRGYGDGYRGRSAWAHNPEHRLGARYPNGQLASRFGAESQASRMAAGRSGNWQSFGQRSPGNRNSFGGAPPRAGGGSFQSQRPSSGWQRFDGPGRSNQGSASWGTQGPQSRSPSQRSPGGPRSYASPGPERGFISQAAPRSYASQAPQRGYGYQAPQRSFNSQAPQRSYGYQAPQRSFSYQAPQRSFQAAPRMSAPSFGGGGGIRSSGGGIRSSGGGGSFHSSGGGGGFRSAGGGGGSHGGGGGSHGSRR